MATPILMIYTTVEREIRYAIIDALLRNYLGPIYVGAYLVLYIFIVE